MTPAEQALVFAWMFVLCGDFAERSWREGNRLTSAWAWLAAACFLTLWIVGLARFYVEIAA